METENKVGPIEVERLDDIPVLFGHLQKMQIQETLDAEIDPHGNWAGLSPGWVITIWLIHILSEHSHCMDRVEEWAEKHLHTLRGLTGQRVTAQDFTDDRLAICLRMMSQRPTWTAIETRLGECLIRVYRLGEAPTARLDAMTGSVYHDAASSQLFKLGKAKKGEYATQYKLMLASLDPLGLTLAVDVAPGNRADDPLYVPCYRRVKQVLRKPGLLVVGDSKMSALETRATIMIGEDLYLTPWAYRKEEPGLLTELLTPWKGREDELERVYSPSDLPEDGTAPDAESALAYGFEVSRWREAEVDGEQVQWEERLLVVRSLAYTASTQKRLQRRLERAEAALRALTPPRGRGKRQIRKEADLLAAIQRIEARYRVQGYFTYDYQRQVRERQVRAYGDKPARTERDVRYQLTVTRCAEAIAQAEFEAGWRIYVTNAPPERLTLAHAVLAYRGQYIVENVFRRLQGKELSIDPLYVQRDDHAQGLLHVLTLAARVLAVGDYTAKQALAAAGDELSGIYPGNPKRSTATPTTERMLAAFDNLNLLLAPVAGQIHCQVTPLTAVQQRILALWGLPETLYTALGETLPGA
jgi:transposase